MKGKTTQVFAAVWVCLLVGWCVLGCGGDDDTDQCEDFCKRCPSPLDHEQCVLACRTCGGGCDLSEEVCEEVFGCFLEQCS